ncbi:UNKNOWN [Stylonychia lemnae]|uniref:Uncharacterized protein n=1 Tax=Stylonychia lemnae TaxID=5949 RepID=A0A078B4G1_STYLE|nr:UNKNOWN [Stylonychia lemnae]|eukprot:CDW89400.1 UNKNOWN [Stylonychia lemnae]
MAQWQLPLVKSTSFMQATKIPVVIRVDDDFYDENTQTVGELLSDGDELVVDLYSADIWITVKTEAEIIDSEIEQEMEPQKINIEFQIKVQRQWTNSHLAKIIQKFLYKSLDTQLQNQQQIYVMTSIEFSIKQPQNLQQSKVQRQDSYDFEQKQSSNKDNANLNDQQPLEENNFVDNDFDFDSILKVKIWIKEIKNAIKDYKVERHDHSQVKIDPDHSYFNFEKDSSPQKDQEMQCEKQNKDSFSKDRINMTMVQAQETLGNQRRFSKIKSLFEQFIVHKFRKNTTINESDFEVRRNQQLNTSSIGIRPNTSLDQNNLQNQSRNRIGSITQVNSIFVHKSHETLLRQRGEPKLIHEIYGVFLVRDQKQDNNKVLDQIAIENVDDQYISCESSLTLSSPSEEEEEKQQELKIDFQLDESSDILFDPNKSRALIHQYKTITSNNGFKQHKELKKYQSQQFNLGARRKSRVIQRFEPNNININIVNAVELDANVLTLYEMEHLLLPQIRNLAVKKQFGEGDETLKLNDLNSDLLSSSYYHKGICKRLKAFAHSCLNYKNDIDTLDQNFTRQINYKREDVLKFIGMLRHSDQQKYAMIRNQIIRNHLYEHENNSNQTDQNIVFDENLMNAMNLIEVQLNQERLEMLKTLVIFIISIFAMAAFGLKL